MQCHTHSINTTTTNDNSVEDEEEVVVVSTNNLRRHSERNLVRAAGNAASVLPTKIEVLNSAVGGVTSSSSARELRRSDGSSVTVEKRPKSGTSERRSRVLSGKKSSHVSASNTPSEETFSAEKKEKGIADAWNGEPGTSTQHHVVVCSSGCGQIFELMTRFLSERRGWEDGSETLLPVILEGILPSLPVHGKNQRLPSAAPTRGASGLVRNACCNRLAPCSLFLGDKLTTERFIEDAQQVAIRTNRQASAAKVRGGAAGTPQSRVSGYGTGDCIHVRAWSSGKYPLSSTKHTLVNYIAGFRSITLKSRLVRTLLYYHRGNWDKLGQYLPLTFQLVPNSSGKHHNATSSDERAEMVECMCRCNAVQFKETGEIATYWIAKSSHGAHGSNIRIFFADQAGLDALIRFIDGQVDPYAWVVSRYMDRPLLYRGRKFDVRCWVLVSPNFDIFLHRRLVMRTSSEVYDRKNLTTDNMEGRLANITNHCVQAEGNHYAAFEEGNELWADDLDALVRDHYRSLTRTQREASLACAHLNVQRRRVGSSHFNQDEASNNTASLANCILPQIRKIVIETILAARKCSAATGAPRLNLSTPISSFQLMGYDFLIDDRLVVWLLEVNGSPGVAQKVIGKIVEDTILTVVDPVFDPSFAEPASSCEFDCIYKNEQDKN